MATNDPFEQLAFSAVLAAGVGGSFLDPWERVERVVEPSLFLKAAMVLERPVRLTLADGSYLEGLVHSSALNRLGTGVVSHVIVDERGEHELRQDEIAAFALAPPPLEPITVGPRQRLSPLAAEPVGVERE